MAPPKIYKNFINGEWVESVTGQAFEDVNPANRNELVGMFPKSTSEDVDNAVAAAKEAYKFWRLMPAPKRGEILFRAARLLLERKETLAEEMTREMGKVLAETRGDVQEAIDMTFYMAGEGRRLFGQTTPSELPNKFGMTVRSPIGVCGTDHALELPHGHSILEDDAGVGLRQHGGHQASHRHAAVHLQPGADPGGSGPAARRRQLGHRLRRRRGHGADDA